LEQLPQSSIDRNVKHGNAKLVAKELVVVSLWCHMAVEHGTKEELNT
jgi:hypothetical protein